MASWCKVFLLAVLLRLLHKAAADCNSEGKSCDQCYQTLASFLVNTSDNLYQLQRAFFPPEKNTFHFCDCDIQLQEPQHLKPNMVLECWNILLLPATASVSVHLTLLWKFTNWRRNSVTLTLPANCANAPDEFMELLTQLVSTCVLPENMKHAS